MKNQGDRPDSRHLVAEIVRGLYRIFQNVDLFSRKALRDLGVTGPQIWALRTILNSECTSVSELAERIHLHPNTVSGIVDRLEERGVATRRQAFEDDRVAELRLTGSGRTLVSSAPEHPQSKMVRGVELLSSEELVCLYRAVGMLTRILDVAGPVGEAEPK